MLQDVVAGVGIAEGHVPEFHFSLLPGQAFPPLAVGDGGVGFRTSSTRFPDTDTRGHMI